MVEGGGQNHQADDSLSAEELLSCAQSLVPKVLRRAKEVKNFPGRWKMIISKLDQIPSRLSDLSSHPCFSKNPLCKEQLQAVSKTLKETIELADICVREKFQGKLRMQSDLDSLAGKLDLNLRDCGLLIKTGVLSSTGPNSQPDPESAATGNTIGELLARLQIGHLESKHRALDALVEAMKDDEKDVLAVIGRAHVSALVQLLSATTSSPRIREKAAAVACQLAESGGLEGWLISEGALPPLIRLVESGGPVSRERAAVALQRLSASPDAARAISGHGGAHPLIEACRAGDSISQAAAACALRNMSAVPEARRALAEEGLVRAMISVLDRGILLSSKEYAAECLQNLTSGNDDLKRAVISEGGVRSLLSYLDAPLPQESATAALRNLVGLLPNEVLMAAGGVVPRLAHVLRSGSPGARRAAAGAVVRICGGSVEMKRSVGESGCIPHLVRMLEDKSNEAREVGAQAIAGLMTVSCNRREVKRNEKSVPSLVALLDPGPHNTVKKYAVSCLGMLSSSKKCRKLMVSYGAIGYLKKLTEMEVQGAKKLLERLERGRLKGLFVRK